MISGISLVSSDPVPELPTTSKYYGNLDIRNVREYLRYLTVHPNINYGNKICFVSSFLFSTSGESVSTEPTVTFLKRLAAEAGLPVSVYYPVNAQNPVVVMTWAGSQPSLPSIMLNSHTDVVPVYEQFWTRPPFAADIDEYGRIIARGIQDTKGLGMIQYTSVKRLKASNVVPKRTIHICFTPDEELGGFNGMAGFVTSQAFKSMNVGYALDEGGVSPTNTIGVFYDERCPWQVEFIVNGPTGHASLLIANTAGEKLYKLLGPIFEMRKAEDKKLASGVPYGKVTTINLTILKGGVQANVVPTDFRATVDFRLGESFRFSIKLFKLD